MLNIIEVKDAITLNLFMISYDWEKQFIKIIANETLLIRCLTFSAIYQLVAGCITCWCPCITFGRIAEIVDKGTTCEYNTSSFVCPGDDHLLCANFLAQTTFMMVLERYLLDVRLWFDFCCSLCCKRSNLWRTFMVHWLSLHILVYISN
jgi:hypothetical protein